MGQKNLPFASLKGNTAFIVDKKWSNCLYMDASEGCVFHFPEENRSYHGETPSDVARNQANYFSPSKVIFFLLAGPDPRSRKRLFE